MILFYGCWRRVCPNSTVLPHLSSYNRRASAWAAFGTQCLMSGVPSAQLHTPPPTPHPPVLLDTSYCLSAKFSLHLSTSDFTKPLKKASSLTPAISTFTTSPQRAPQPHPARCRTCTSPPPHVFIETAPCQHSLPIHTTSLIFSPRLSGPSMCVSDHWHGVQICIPNYIEGQRRQDLPPALAVSTSLEGTTLQQEVPATLHLGLWITSLLLVHWARETGGDERDTSQKLRPVRVSGYRNQSRPLGRPDTQWLVFSFCHSLFLFLSQDCKTAFTFLPNTLFPVATIVNPCQPGQDSCAR